MSFLWKFSQTCNEVMTCFLTCQRQKLTDIFFICMNFLRKTFILILERTMSHFKPQMSVQDAQNLTIASYDEINFSQLSAVDDRKSRRFYIKTTYLHASKSVKKMKAWTINRNGSGSSLKDMPSCDRFIVLGVNGSQHVVLIFTQNAQESKMMLRYSDHLYPGHGVYLVNPQLMNFIGDNTVVCSKNPLIPFAEDVAPINILPPCNMEKPHYAFFNFTTNKMHFASAAPIDSVCNGRFCDSQSERASCACVAADSKKHWVVEFVFSCDEFNDMSRDDVVFSSKRTTQFFVLPHILSLPLSDFGIDTPIMEDNVSSLIFEVFYYFDKSP